MVLATVISPELALCGILLWLEKYETPLGTAQNIKFHPMSLFTPFLQSLVRFRLQPRHFRLQLLRRAGGDQELRGARLKDKL